MASPMRRLVTSTLAAVLTTGAVLAWASPAASADDVRVYEGRYGGIWYTYTATCTGETCLLTTQDPPAVLAEFLAAPLTVSGGTARAQLPTHVGRRMKASTQREPSP